jgi:hypothetical protein
MNSERDTRPQPTKLQGSNGDDSAQSGIVILVFFTIVTVLCIGGYFLLIKLIDISRQDDCILSGRRNCASIIMPADRFR